MPHLAAIAHAPAPSTLWTMIAMTSAESSISLPRHWHHLAFTDSVLAPTPIAPPKIKKHPIKNRLTTTTSKEEGANSNNVNDDNDARALGNVALVVPWLKSREERIKLYGKEHYFCPVIAHFWNQWLQWKP